MHFPRYMDTAHLNPVKNRQELLLISYFTPDLIPHIRVGMLSEAQGSNSDHFAFGIDINEHSLWQTQAIVNPLIRRRGFSTENNLKKREFVTKLYDLIKNSDIELIMNRAQMAIKADEDIKKRVNYWTKKTSL